MINKEIVVLANSVKNQNKCIAGRELVQNSNGQLTLGEWVRPVSEHDHGALSCSEVCCLDGSISKILDGIKMSLKEKNDDPTQPENWMIANETWEKKRVVHKNSLDSFIEFPNGLWIDSKDSRIDRISTQAYMAQGFNSSLCVIQPDRFCLEIYYEQSCFSGSIQKKRRAKFLYNGVNYNLALTDPQMETKYGMNMSFNEDSSREVHIENPLLCISLGTEFHGYHYKLVATVIER